MICQKVLNRLGRRGSWSGGFVRRWNLSRSYMKGGRETTCSRRKWERLSLMCRNQLDLVIMKCIDWPLAAVNRNTQNGLKSTIHRTQTMTFWTPCSKVLFPERSAKKIDCSKKRKCQLSFELQSSHVFEKCSNWKKPVLLVLSRTL